MSGLPLGWSTTSLDNLVRLKTGPFGSSLHRSDYVAGQVPLINPSHILNGKLVPDPEISVSAVVCQRLSECLLQAGDVVMGRRGEMGRCAVVPDAAAGWMCGTGSVTLRPSQAIRPSFLQRLLTSPETVARLNSASVGSTMVNLNQRVLLDLPARLPPLEEQQRIVDKLEAVLGRVDACRDRLDRVGPLLQRFRQSVLAAAVSGQLISAWRGLPTSAEWEKTTLGQLAEIGTGSTPLRSKAAFFADQGTPWITSSATSRQFIDTADEYVTDLAIKAHRLRVYPPGTLLVAMYGEGKTRGQVAELSIHATINQACSAILVDESAVLKDFVKLALRANYLAMRLLAEGGNQPNLNLSKVRSVPLLLPSLDEQAELVRRVRHLFGLADRLEHRLATALNTAGRLTPAVLAKAFRGDLVPQDPTDEPAQALLDRLRAARASEPPGRRRRQPAGA